MQKEQTALAKDSNTARNTAFDRVLDVLVITRKTTAFGLFKDTEKEENPFIPYP